MEQNGEYEGSKLSTGGENGVDHSEQKQVKTSKNKQKQAKKTRREQWKDGEKKTRGWQEKERKKRRRSALARAVRRHYFARGLARGMTKTSRTGGSYLPACPAKGVLNNEPIRYLVIHSISFCSSSSPVSGDTNTFRSSCVICPTCFCFCYRHMRTNVMRKRQRGCVLAAGLVNTSRDNMHTIVSSSTWKNTLNDTINRRWGRTHEHPLNTIFSLFTLNKVACSICVVKPPVILKNDVRPQLLVKSCFKKSETMVLFWYFFNRCCHFSDQHLRQK